MNDTNLYSKRNSNYEKKLTLYMFRYSRQYQSPCRKQDLTITISRFIRILNYSKLNINSNFLFSLLSHRKLMDGTRTTVHSPRKDNGGK